MSSGSASLVEFRDASVARGGHTVWSDGSFTVPTGSIVPVIGPNGSGKSTLLLVLLGLLRLATGSVTVLGATPRRGNPRIGYVPQTYTTPGGELMRARDLAALGLTGTRWGVGRLTAAQRDQVDTVLGSVDALDFADARMSQLSGGQAQRIAIAQALMGGPDLLLLDEPLANLDVRNQGEQVRLLDRLRSRQGISSLVVVHDLNPVLSVMTAAIYLLDGHAHYAPADHVVSEDLLTHLYGTTIRVVRTPQGDLFARNA